MKIAGLTKTTLLDFPEYVAATIFTAGCNFRCPFCHNRNLIDEISSDVTLISENEILEFLEKRKNILAGVCISGGEPTIQADLPAFIRKIKDLGYLVKLDTNGFHPEILEGLMKEKLLDFIAMDVKNVKGKYALTSGLDNIDLEKIETSIELIKKSGIPHEFRTTVVKDLHTIDDLIAIGAWLAGGNVWFLQSYQDNENVLRKGLNSYSDEEITSLVGALHEQGIGIVKKRG